MKKYLVLVAAFALLFGLTGFAGASSYRVLGTESISWGDARTLAKGLGAGWDLATITSADEQAAVDLVLGASYIKGAPGDRNEFWIGGVNNGGWAWVTGETWDYTNWWGGEPNNVGGIEGHLALDYRLPGTYNNGPVGLWKWNDEGSAPQQIIGFVAELQSVPEPTTMLLLGLGLVGLAGIRRNKL